MKLITIEQARAQCKVEDSDEDMTLLECARAAEERCARLANRNIYATIGEKATAIAASTVKLGDARVAYDAAVAAIPGDASTLQLATMMRAAHADMDAAVLEHERAVTGIVVNDDIRHAVLLTVGKYYRHREDVTDERVGVLPEGAARIMRHYRWAGDL